ncbi:MAG: DMT family transporter [Gaiellales bacterium]
MPAIGLGLLAGILFGLLTVLVRRGILRTPDPIAGSVIVVAIATAIVVVEALVSGHAGDLLDLRPAAMYFLIGLIAPGASQVIFMLAVRDVGASRVAVMIGTAPLLATIIAVVFRGEPLKAGLLAGTILIVIGGASLAYERNLPAGFRARGMLLAFLCALLFACRDNAMRAVGLDTTMDPRAATAWALIGALVAVAGFALVTRRSALPGQLRGVFISFLPAAIVFGIAYTTLTIALHVGKVTVFAPLNAMQSMWTVLLAWLILGRADGIGFRVVAAMLLVVSGGILIGIFR